jgi:hypothetical protein
MNGDNAVITRFGVASDQDLFVIGVSQLLDDFHDQSYVCVLAVVAVANPISEK